ncbi:hypothetical protein Syun_012292 [Stephania yunnanensis]|uniref:Uncharacterized protein n=1 Tax=Stephania yunnanensis TaxID=152371 RepID=A0AAP0K1L7_9MAGN
MDFVVIKGHGPMTWLESEYTIPTLDMKINQDMWFADDSPMIEDKQKQSLVSLHLWQPSVAYFSLPLFSLHAESNIFTVVDSYGQLPSLIDGLFTVLYIHAFLISFVLFA